MRSPDEIKDEAPRECCKNGGGRNPCRMEEVCDPVIADAEDAEVTFGAIEQAWSIKSASEFFGHSQWIQGKGVIQPCKETLSSLSRDPERDLFGTVENLLWLIPYAHHVQDSLVVRAK